MALSGLPSERKHNLISAWLHHRKFSVLKRLCAYFTKTFNEPAKSIMAASDAVMGVPPPQQAEWTGGSLIEFLLSVDMPCASKHAFLCNQASLLLKSICFLVQNEKCGFIKFCNVSPNTNDCLESRTGVIYELNDYVSPRFDGVGLLGVSQCDACRLQMRREEHFDYQLIWPLQERQSSRRRLANHQSGQQQEQVAHLCGWQSIFQRTQRHQ